MKIIKIEIEAKIHPSNYEIKEEELAISKRAFAFTAGLDLDEIIRFEIIEKDENTNRSDNSIG